MLSEIIEYEVGVDAVRSWSSSTNTKAFRAVKDALQSGVGIAGAVRSDLFKDATTLADIVLWFFDAKDVAEAGGFKDVEASASGKRMLGQAVEYFRAPKLCCEGSRTALLSVGESPLLSSDGQLVQCCTKTALEEASAIAKDIIASWAGVFGNTTPLATLELDKLDPLRKCYNFKAVSK